MEITPRLLAVCEAFRKLNFIKDVRLWRFPENPHITLAVNLLQAKIHIPMSAFSLGYIARELGVTPIGMLESILRDAGRKLQSQHFYSIEDFVEVVKEVIGEAIGISTDEFRVTIQPTEGEPWDFKKTKTSYYSVRHKKWFDSSKPPMVTPKTPYQVEFSGDLIQEPVLDWCKVLPKVESGGRAALLQANEERYVVSHCFSSLDGLKEAISSCKGLLFPSIAVGLISSNNFGPFTLIVDPQVILQGLKPYRTKKGLFPVHVYKTDTWTHKTSAFMGPIGRRALLEWAGYSDGRNDLQFDLLLQWDPDETAPLRNTKQLQQRLKALRKRWNHRDYSRIRAELHEYPYIEAKVNGVLSLSSCSLAFAPKESVPEFKKLLKKGGFTGQVIGLENLPPPFHPDGTFKWQKSEQWEVGWRIRDYLLGLSSEQDHRLLLSNPIHPNRMEALKKQLKTYLGKPENFHLNSVVGNLVVDRALSELSKADPTSSGKYLSWLVKEYISGRITLPEDIDILNESLRKFHKYKSRLADKDIFHYSKGQLIMAVGDFPSTDLTNEQIYARAVHEGKQFLAEDGPYRAFRLTTPEATRAAAKNTAWCVSSLRVAEDYLASGELILIEKNRASYVLAHGGYERVQSHIEADSELYPTFQIRDVRDETLGVDEKRELAPVVRQAFREFMSQKIRKFGNSIELAFYKETGQPSSNPHGWGHLETDKEYLSRWLMYAEELMGGRDSETEQVLLAAKNAYILVQYAARVIYGFFPEAEPIIVTDPRATDRYISEMYQLIFRSDPSGIKAVAEKFQAWHDRLLQNFSNHRPRANPRKWR